MPENDFVMCPLVNRMIQSIDCMENSDAVDGILKKDSIPEEYKELQNWEETCKNCKWHNY
ncbi:MAG: hypothetical protein K2H52_14080 [Lachnospiraceae bacterium]|nr:hypothetical protein [Lachnospiraceae bacterium]MDE7285838.1 hypothetical protein [Lachnospiraceae bacterium]